MKIYFDAGFRLQINNTILRRCPQNFQSDFEKPRCDAYRNTPDHIALTMFIINDSAIDKVFYIHEGPINLLPPCPADRPPIHNIASLPALPWPVCILCLSHVEDQAQAVF